MDKLNDDRFWAATVSAHQSTNQVVGMSEEGMPKVAGYEPIELIGRGGSAEVWKMRDADGHTKAVKILRDRSGLSSRAEWKALLRYQGEHVVPVVELTRDKIGRTALVMDFCPGGTLEEVVLGRGGLTVGELSAALSPVAAVVSQLHREGIVHGDISPTNILFTAEGVPQVADFGCLRHVDDLSVQEWCTEGFTAPEVVDGQPPGRASDVYALGALAWFTLAGRPPEIPALRPHLRDEFPDVPPALSEAISSALSLTPSARLEVSAFERALRGAARPVRVPVPDASQKSCETSMTYRRRAGAVERQKQQGRAEAKHRRPPRRRGVLVGMTALAGGAALALGMLWPTPGPSARKQSHQAIRAAGQAKPSQSSTSKVPQTPRRTVAPVALPQRQEVERLLDCRARAWNQRSVAVLSQCLASRSQALADDTAQLRTATAARISYAGLNYAVRSVRSIVLEAGQPTARVVVSQSKYSIRDPNGTRNMGAEEHTVRLTFKNESRSWRISSWNVV